MENNKTALENKRAAMEKRKALIEKKKKEMKRRKIITLIIAVIMTVAGVAVGFALGRSSAVPDEVSISTQNEEGRLSIMSTTQNGEWITVKTSYITLRYPFAFSDIIETEAYNEGLVSQLRFYSNINGKKILNYVIYFNSNEGIPCGILKLQDEISVSVEFEKAPKKLSDDWLNTFYAVQETFNDVLKSMEENKAFVSIA